MEEIKKDRTSKARLVSRVVTEVLNGVHCYSKANEITDKINNLKYAMEELGKLHDEYIGRIDLEDVETLDVESEWYNNDDFKVNRAIKEAR